jgi:2-polyprenyl-6-methoxyphenol hydroxylase-like FAD-dependent oxidoreductase
MIFTPQRAGLDKISPRAESDRAVMTSMLIGKQAIVVGAGVAGLTAARAVADYFEQVVVLERDTLSPDISHRAGTPQSRHAHVLLGGGQRALNDLFPGFAEDLALAGAVPCRAGLALRIERPGYDPFPQRDLGWVGYSMSRPLIEFSLRRRVERFAKITARQRCRASGIVAKSDGAAVEAVRCETGDGRSETLPADFIVDASGRGTLTLDLLHSIRQARPEETVIGIDIGYASAVFGTPGDAARDWKGVFTFPQAPASSRGAVVLPLEGGRWIVSLGGRHGEKPPGDEDGFLEYARQLRTPTVYNAIKKAERLSTIACFGFRSSVRRHFGRLEDFPSGLLPLGDAICRFNPVYGQGMSVAAQQACLLHRLLATRSKERDPLAGLSPTFFARADDLIETPWRQAAIPDFVFPETRGQRPTDFDRTLQFGLVLNELAAADPGVHKLMVEVHHLLKPQSVLRDPGVLRRIGAERNSGAGGSA